MKRIINIFFIILFSLTFFNSCSYHKGSLVFNKTDEIIYPYIDEVRLYLEAGEDADVNKFNFHQNTQAKEINLSWNLLDTTVSKYILEISTNQNYTQSKKVIIDGEKTSYSLKYLLKDTNYYFRLSVPHRRNLVAETSFKTTYLGPRFLDVNDLFHNCRDLGGYKIDNKIIKYNKIIRGSSPDDCKTNCVINEEGMNFLTDEIGIKTQLDFRGGENGGITNSFFKNANYIQIPIKAYAPFETSQKELYYQAFKVFIEPNNYPIYFHCVGGADRTGTIAALLLAYLGVSKKEIIQDYVVTSFTPVCYEQDARSKEVILPILNGLDNYQGNNLSEKCKNYLLSLGLNQNELDNIYKNVISE